MRVLLYLVIFLLALCGNALIIVVLVVSKRLRTVTNSFLLSLALSDLMVALFCLPFTFLPNLMRSFIFGKVVCKAMAYLMGEQSRAVSESGALLVEVPRDKWGPRLPRGQREGSLLPCLTSCTQGFGTCSPPPSGERAGRLGAAWPDLPPPPLLQGCPSVSPPSAWWPLPSSATVPSAGHCSPAHGRPAPMPTGSLPPPGCFQPCSCCPTQCTPPPRRCPPTPTSPTAATTGRGTTSSRPGKLGGWTGLLRARQRGGSSQQ